MTLEIDQFEDRNVCIIGLGFVGMTLAVTLADLGFRVHGVEKNDAIMAALKEGRALFEERSFEWRLKKVLKAGRLTPSNVIPSFDRDDLSDGGAAASPTVFIITVGTPVGDDKRTRMESIETAAHEVAAALRPGDLVVLRSTVRVGVSRDVVKPILDAKGVSYDMAFCPERTVEGKAIEELRTLPQIVGGADMRSSLRASRFFHMLTPSVVRVSSLEAAELVKLVNNVHRDLMFAFANEIGEAAEASGLSAMEVIDAANRGYPRGGVCLPGPVGGPCLEKDSYIMAEGLSQHGYRPALTLAGRALNERLPGDVTARVKRILTEQGLDGPTSPARKIAVLGLAFKGRPETSDLRGTIAAPLYRELVAAFPAADITAWDPVVRRQDAAREIGVRMTDNIASAFENADAVVIQNNHPVFEHLDFPTLSALMRPNGLIYDLWAMNDGEELVLEGGVVYGAFGAAALTRGASSAIDAITV